MALDDRSGAESDFGPHRYAGNSPLGEISPFFAALKRASWRGLPFGVLANEIRVGRRQVVHEYPNRDVVWVEDMGRAVRRVTLTGFLVGDDVLVQQERMLEACEEPGSGVLIHPAFGRLDVSLFDVAMRTSRDSGRVVEVAFVFIESGVRVFPSPSEQTGRAVQQSALAMLQASVGRVVTQLRTALSLGSAVAHQVVDTVNGIGQQVSGLARDATGLYGMVKDLPQSISGAYGRYFAGGLSGFADTASSVKTVATIGGLIALGAAARANVSAKVDAMQSAAVEAPLDPTLLATAMPDAFAALSDAIVDPATALRVLPSLYGYVEPAAGGISAIPLAMQGAQEACLLLNRRAAMQVLAVASSNYQPQSADDALRVRRQVTDLLDLEITAAGDSGDDEGFEALRALRAQVALDLATRGAALPPIVDVRTPSAVPALVLAQRLYRDAARADQLTIFGNPRHPAFMPTDFRALAS